MSVGVLEAQRASSILTMRDEALLFPDEPLVSRLSAPEVAPRTGRRLGPVGARAPTDRGLPGQGTVVARHHPAGASSARQARPRWRRLSRPGETEERYRVPPLTSARLAGLSARRSRGELQCVRAGEEPAAALRRPAARAALEHVKRGPRPAREPPSSRLATAVRSRLGRLAEPLRSRRAGGSTARRQTGRDRPRGR